MSFSAPQFTNVGRQLQARALAGDQLTFTKMQMGDGNLSGGTIAALTALIHNVVTIEVYSAQRSGETATVKGAFTNSGLSSGFYWKEIGLFAADPDFPNDRSKDILYCYQNAGSLAEYIPAASSEVVEKVIAMGAVVGDAESVTAILASDVYALNSDLESHTQNQTNPHNVTALQIGALSTNGGTISGALSVTGNAVIPTITSLSTVNAGGAEWSTVNVNVTGNLKHKGSTVYSPDNKPTAEDIGAADADHTHSAGDITGGTLAVARGGTGVTANPSMLTNLGSSTAAGVFAASPRPGVTGTLAIANGGTGSTTAADALTSLGAAASGHKHAAGDITSGTLAIARGGTGVTANPSMLTNLGSTTAGSVFAASPRPGVTGTLPIANGGTGATTAADARTNLGVAYGTAAGTVCQGNDSRLSNARTPTAHNQAAGTITAGTFAGKVLANATEAATLTAGQVRNIGAQTSPITAGSSAITTGAVWLVYE